MENDLSTSKFEDMFREAETATYNGRVEAEKCRDYVDGRQLTDQERRTLAKRRQPAVVNNRIRRKIAWLVGLEIKQRTDPKAFPREPGAEADADAITDALRFVADNTRFDGKKTAVWSDMLVEGFGGVEVVHKKNAQGEVEIEVNRYPWDRLFYDPHSREPDFSDARYLGSVVWQDVSAIQKEHADKATDIEGQVVVLNRAESGFDTFDDRPKSGLWYDAKRKRARVVVIWHEVDGEWHWCKFMSGVKLGAGKSVYVNEQGESQCPLILQSLYVDRDNDRYGVVRDMISPQDEINKRRSKALHLLNSRQVRVSPHVVDQQDLSQNLARPDGVIRAERDEFEVLSTSDLAQGQVALLGEAKDEIDLMGANSALAGDTGESQSGRAVLARQQGGLIEIAPEMDLLAQFTQRVYEAMWCRVRQFWTAERWVRVTDDERNVRFVGLNRPITFGERLGQEPPERVQEIARQLALVPNDPRLFQVIGTENNVAEISVDIILEEVPDRITLAGEVFEALLKYGPALPPAVLIEADPSLPAAKKEKLLELMQNQQPSQEQQIDAAKGEASAMKDMAAAQKLQAEAQAVPVVTAAGF